MSFMSDLKTPIGLKMAFASEATFLAPLGLLPENQRRSYWENAKNLLHEFLVKHTPSAVGLQEMNITDSGDTGTNAIQNMLDTIPRYKMIRDKVTTNNAGLSIIYDEAKIGELKATKCIDNETQKGRPLLMLLTEKEDKQYLSISIHGAQDPNLRLNMDAFNQYMLTNNKAFLQEEANVFLTENHVVLETLAGIFVMGDFNDRYDAITELVINDLKVEYKGLAPKSCCHNWDSSCPDTDVEIDFQNTYKTCKEPPAQERIQNGAKLPLPDDRGKIENYKYSGDKVFGLNPKSNLEIFKYDERKENRSFESDHELVFATVGELNAEAVVPATSGGKRRSRKTKQRSRKSRRMNRKTRKSSRKSKR
jgi:hypothetical protein